MSNSKKILLTVLATVGMLIFYISSGALVVIKELGDIKGALVQGAFIWCFAIILILISLIKNKSLAPIGFKKIDLAGAKSLIFFAPMILIALSNLYGGFVSENVVQKIFVSLFLTIGVGFSEEIVCRGIICNLWKENSIKRGIVVSSIVFGLSHSFNVLGGASVVATILQVCFAFFYGIVMAVIFLKTESVIPCIFLHFLHDFCSFISAEVSLTTDIVTGAIQVVVLIAYGIFALRILFCKKDC